MTVNCCTNYHKTAWRRKTVSLSEYERWEESECAADDFTLTGIAYQDGVLRVQMCMGDNTHADRNVQLFLTDAVGNERHNDDWVSWHEDVGEMRYVFYENSFLIEKEELEYVGMYGIFYQVEESVKGDWKVTFWLE